MTPHMLSSLLFYILPIVIVLGVVVTVHELGHFLTARALGTRVERFSIGFGRAIAAWRDRGGVEWRIGWVPLGGYVKFAGDENAASVPDADDLAELRQEILAHEGPRAVASYFHFKPLWERALIVAAGPAANFVLAIAIFTILLMTLGAAHVPPQVGEVEAESAAARAGLKPGDLILSIDGARIEEFADIKMKVLLSSDTPMRLIVRRGTREVAITATPVRTAQTDQFGHVQRLGQLGIKPPPVMQYRRYGPVAAVRAAVGEVWDRIYTTVEYIARLAQGRETADQLSGPLGMAQFSGDIAKQTAAESPNLSALLLNWTIAILELIATISVGVGFINLLPVPVLDGGHLLFYAYEGVARRPLGAKVQAAGYRVGLALVLGLMLFATWNDLQRLHVSKLFGALFS